MLLFTETRTVNEPNDSIYTAQSFFANAKKVVEEKTSTMKR